VDAKRRDGDIRHHPRGPYVVRVPRSATVAEATLAVHTYLHRKQLEEKSLAQNNGGLLFGYQLTAENKNHSINGGSAAAASLAPPRTLQALHGHVVSTHSLATLMDIPSPGHASSSTGLLALRPCDPLGYVLDRSVVQNPMAPESNMLSCFPKGGTSFFVCLAPDPIDHRRRIRNEKLAAIQAEEAVAHELLQKRAAVIAAKDVAQRSSEASACHHSSARAASLRSDMLQPKGSVAYKAFVKQEAHDEKSRQREIQQLTEERSRRERLAAAKSQWQAFFRAIHVDVVAASSTVISQLAEEELRERERIWAERGRCLELQGRKERCAVLLKRVPEQVEALRTGASPFAQWTI
jgi:hypothetical protein